jgi:hypothetical protein
MISVSRISSLLSFIALLGVCVAFGAETAGSIDPQRISQAVKVLASDEFEGRAPGTPGEAKTIEWLTKYFGELGLETSGLVVRLCQLCVDSEHGVLGLRLERLHPLLEAREGLPLLIALGDDALVHLRVVMREVLAQKNIKAENVIYIGNDLNDLPCFEVAGWSVAVADAYPEVIRAADHVLTKAGGHGALRELCDLILKNS